MSNTRFVALKKFLKRLGIGLLATCILIWGLMWLASPMLSHWIASDVLAAYKLRLHDDSHVRVNLALLKVGITDLEMQDAKGAVLNIPSLELDLSFWPLLFKRVHVDSLTIDGVQLQLSVDEYQAVVAGFDIPLSEEAAVESSSTPETESGESIVFDASVASFAMTNTHLNIDYHGNQERLVLSSMELKDFAFNADALKGLFSTTVQVEDGEFDLAVSLDGSLQDLSLDLTANIEQFDLSMANKHIVEQGIEVSGLLSVEFKTELSVSETGISLRSEQFGLDLNQFGFVDPLYKVEGSSFAIKSDALDVDIQADSSLNVSTAFGVDLNKLAVRDAQSLDTLLDLDAMDLSSGRFSFNGKDVDAEVAALEFSGLILSKKTSSSPSSESETELPPLLTVALTSIADIRFKDSFASVQSIGISGLEISAFMDGDSQLSNLIDFPATTESDEELALADESSEAPASETESAESEALSFAISEIALLDAAKIHIKDESIQPNFNKSLELTKVSIKNIDSSNVDALTTFEMNLKDEEYFSVNVSGDMQAFKEKLNLNAKAKVSELSLPETSAYQMKYLSFGTQRGQLNTKLDVKVIDSIMDGAVKIDINGAKFSNSDTVDAYSVLNQGAVPLNVALDLIKDKKGNISLKVPLSGDVEDPNFGMQHILGLVIKKAAMSQAKSYLMNTFVPYAKVVSVAMAAGSYALKVRFEDLQYVPAQVEVEEAQEEFIAQFIDLMEKDTKLVVHVCPISTVEESADTVGLTELSDEQKSILLNIASNRANTFKRYVVDNSEIESQRLLVCAPSVDLRSDATPKITLSAR